MTAIRPILVAVDDERENLDLVMRTLGGVYDVRTFTAPKSALVVVPNIEPAVLVLDFKMPDLSGVERGGSRPGRPAGPGLAPAVALAVALAGAAPRLHPTAGEPAALPRVAPEPP